VDYLLEAESASLEAVLLFPGKTEAELIPPLLRLGAEPAAMGFGASDRRAKTHLFHLPHRRLVQLPGGIWVR